MQTLWEQAQNKSMWASDAYPWPDRCDRCGRRLDTLEFAKVASVYRGQGDNPVDTICFQHSYRGWDCCRGIKVFFEGRPWVHIWLANLWAEGTFWAGAVLRLLGMLLVYALHPVKTYQYARWGREVLGHKFRVFCAVAGRTETVQRLANKYRRIAIRSSLRYLGTERWRWLVVARFYLCLGNGLHALACLLNWVARQARYVANRAS